MVEEPTQPNIVEDIQKVNPQGKYAFQFEEDTTPEFRKEFETLVDTARKEGRNIYLEPGVRAVELEKVSGVKTPEPEPVTAPTPPKPEPSVSTQTPTPATLPQQPSHVLPPNQSIMAQPFQTTSGAPVQYDAWGQPIMPTPPPPPPQPTYHPSAAPSYQWVATPQVVPQPLFQQRQYNPQHAEGPIGQQTPHVPTPQDPQPSGGPASIQHPPYTQHYTNVQGQPQ